MIRLQECPLEQWPWCSLKGVQQIAGGGEEGGAIFDEFVGPFGAGIERGAGNREDVAALFPASLAVIKDPERAAASTTTMARLIPEIMRLRRGK